MIIFFNCDSKCFVSHQAPKSTLSFRLHTVEKFLVPSHASSSLFWWGKYNILLKDKLSAEKNLLFAIVSSQLFLHESADERTTIFSQCWQTSPLENIISVSVSVIDCLHNKLSWISHFIFLLISDFQIKSRWSFLYSIKSWCSFLVDECFWRQTSA